MERAEGPDRFGPCPPAELVSAASARGKPGRAGMRLTSPRNWKGAGCGGPRHLRALAKLGGLLYLISSNRPSSGHSEMSASPTPGIEEKVETRWGGVRATHTHQPACSKRMQVGSALACGDSSNHSIESHTIH